MDAVLSLTRRQIEIAREAPRGADLALPWIGPSAPPRLHLGATATVFGPAPMAADTRLRALNLCAALWEVTLNRELAPLGLAVWEMWAEGLHPPWRLSHLFRPPPVRTCIVAWVGCHGWGGYYLTPMGRHITPNPAMVWPDVRRLPAAVAAA